MALAALPDEPIPAIGYIRVSTAREEMISPKIQKSSIIVWARRNGRRIVRWIEDLDESGRSFKREVRTAIGLVADGTGREIIAYRYDRWGRNTTESLNHIARVEREGGRVQSATEPYDANTAVGKYNRTNALGIAEMQSDIIGDNWRAALDHRAAGGLVKNGTPRFGYIRRGRVPNPEKPKRTIRDMADPAGERYEPDPELAPVLAAMYERYAAGEGFLPIALSLNARGIANAVGRTWSDMGVRSTLDTGFAAGLLQVHDSACGCRAPVKCKRKVFIPGAHEAVISAELWERYRAVRAERLARPPRARTAVYPLTGLVFCGHCRAAMAAQSTPRGGRGYAYRCTRWARSRDCDGPFPRRAMVEAAVLAELEVWAEEIEAETSGTAHARLSARLAAETDTTRLVQALADSDAALRRLSVAQARDERTPAAVWEASRAELLDARERTEAELAAAQARADASAADLEPVILGLIAEWDTLPAADQRELLGQVIRRVEVYRADDPRTPRVEITPTWA